MPKTYLTQRITGIWVALSMIVSIIYIHAVWGANRQLSYVSWVGDYEKIYPIKLDAASRTNKLNCAPNYIKYAKAS